MKKLRMYCYSVLPILAILTSQNIGAYNLLPGSIEYPCSLNERLIQPWRIYNLGEIAECRVDKKNHNQSFDITHYDNQFTFKLLIVDPRSIEYVNHGSKFQSEQTNTIAYRKVKEGESYKFYVLTRVPEILPDSRQIKYSWRIRSEHLSNNRVPDDIIILQTKPDWIASIDGTQGFAFPTINVRSDIISFVGSETQLEKELDELAADRPKHDTIYARQKLAAMKRVNNRLIIAAPVSHATA